MQIVKTARYSYPQMWHEWLQCCCLYENLYQRRRVLSAWKYQNGPRAIKCTIVCFFLEDYASMLSALEKIGLYKIKILNIYSKPLKLPLRLWIVSEFIMKDIEFVCRKIDHFSTAASVTALPIVIFYYIMRRSLPCTLHYVTYVTLAYTMPFRQHEIRCLITICNYFLWIIAKNPFI